MSAYAGRRERSRELLGDEAFLTRDLPTIRYLTGFSGSNATLLMNGPISTLITDGRYKDQARSETQDASIVIDRDAISVVLAMRLASINVDPSMPVGDVDRLRHEGIDIGLVGPSLRDLRSVKDPQELAVLAEACAITAHALEALATVISIGDSEIQLARRLESLFANGGADDRAFRTIVAAGPHSAVPHHQPTTRALQAGDLLVIDCGALVDGYHADMTRTFVVGAEPLPWQQEIHDVVLRAQQAGIRAAAPGVTARDVDNAARSVIASAGFGDAFTHGTGHGVGLQIHEPPMLTHSSADSISAGSPITIEPGIYLPGRGGVRIEDTIVVGDQTRVLTEAPRDLIVVG
ncbi:MAG: aminopeptidase P family protein [Actinomycetota bacterium]|nr:aminopeptidase P family protein [Actinomycetota bacterium]